MNKHKSIISLQFAQINENALATHGELNSMDDDYENNISPYLNSTTTKMKKPNEKRVSSRNSIESG